MQWASLYSDQRSTDTDNTTSRDELRTSFIKDYDRIIFSSAFRRLQNKTQVFPLPGPAFVHNRLTHSLEVASVGRSLGTAVGRIIAKKYEQQQGQAFASFYRHELSSVISSACLAHDIGNPPFGHSGEDAIRSYFTSLDSATQSIFTGGMSANQWADFTHFEGNSNAFRILTHPFAEERTAYNITQTTLASIVKYPCRSIDGFDKNAGIIGKKKSGFFDSESGNWQAIAQQLGIFKQPGFETEEVYVRHPFVYLTEAADDICYRVIDIEDAHRLGILSYQEVAALFLPFFDDDTAYQNRERIQGKLDGLIDPNQKVQYLRAVWISRMVGLCTTAFIAHEAVLLQGNLQESLIDVLPHQYLPLLKAIDQLSYERIYQHRTVVEIEIAGFEVIGNLLDIFVRALLNPEAARSRKVLQLIPAQFSLNGSKQNSLYQRVQAVTDFISGMTDIYAIDLYRKITGITIKAF
ncbi:MAG: dNTP triphosphohydrolase [Sphingobacteriales bacterium]|nr:MAG: dNTP triphosphohydrolase [Sphingobacteriales bacterium]